MNFFQKHRVNILIFFGISIFLVLVWFRNGLIKGVAEPGLPFFEPHITFNVYKYTWLPLNLGEVVLSKNSLLPLFFFLSLLDKIGFPSFLIQALTFLFILIFQGIFVYYLTLFFIKEQKKYNLIGLIAAIFYIFNPFSLLWWNTLQFPLIYFYAVLPAAMFFYTKGLATGKIKYCFYFNLIILIFSSAFENFVLFATLLGFVFFYTVIYLLIFEKKLRLRWCVKYFLLTFLLWLLFNFWWIAPYYKITLLDLSSVETGFNIQFNLSNFEIISKEYGKLIDLIRLDPRWLTSNTIIIWNNSSLLLFKIATFLIPLVTIVTLVGIGRNTFNKDFYKPVYFFIILLLLVLLLTTGANFPLGNLKLFLFKIFKPYQIFRNPVFKIGILLPLCYSIPFAIGLYSLIFHFAKKWFTLMPLVFVIFLSLSWPMLIGYIFTCNTHKLDNPSKGYSVNVPDYYLNTESLLSVQNDDFRLLVLPLNTHLELLVYNWDYGYNGREIFNHVFKKPTVAVMTWFKTKDDFIRIIEKAIYNDTKNVSMTMRLINAKFLIMCGDIVWNAACFRSSFKNFKDLKGKMQFKERKDIIFYQTFGKLDLYKISDKYFLPHIYSTSTPTLVAGDIDTLVPMTETKYLSNKPALLFTEQNKAHSSSLLADSSSLIAHSNKAHSKGQKENFVFKDSMPKDLAIELAHSSLLIAHRFRIKKAGGYEVYIKKSNIKMQNAKWEIKVDGKEIPYPVKTLCVNGTGSSWLPEGQAYGAGLAHSKNRKYIKVGEVELGEGEHKIEAHSSSLIAHSKNQKQKLILVNKEERERIEKQIWQKVNSPETELCYIFEKGKGEFWVP